MTTDDPASGSKGAATANIHDVSADETRNGPVWSQTSEDLNVNLVTLTIGQGIAEHVNSDVDVLIVGFEGEGEVRVDGQSLTLTAGQVVVVPKGTARSISPTSPRLAYLTCHRRRAGLWPT